MGEEKLRRVQGGGLSQGEAGARLRPQHSLPPPPCWSAQSGQTLSTDGAELALSDNK